ncbi:hypothetical protein DRE_04000 [Drechslerella stenobrocha 248]|uniref:Uncharacterized protein n=1 Tax=Drechslerella stenobrocha 248 TaxID=1043628 RepID=W7ICD2_9PEZI|nr:hypothetical protein DRE_04000 [Drechslerella stenobrocha 248]
MTHATHPDDLPSTLRSSTAYSEVPKTGAAQSYYDSTDLSPNPGYRYEEGMRYSKPSIPEPESTEATSTALLSQTDHDPEKHASTSSPSSSRAGNKPPSTPKEHKKNTRLAGKENLTLIRFILFVLIIPIALVPAVTIAVATWSIYNPNKTTSTQATTRPPNVPIYAFPQSINLLPDHLILATALIAFFLSAIAVWSPLWRSSSKFHRKRYVRSEIIELVGLAVTLASGAAALYFAFTQKPDQKVSLWAFACSRSNASSADNTTFSLYPEPDLFPNINYVNACRDYNVAVYMLCVVVALVAINLITYTVNPCLKRKWGKYQGDDGAGNAAMCDCCFNCASLGSDCLSVFQCCFCCCALLG